MRKISLVAVLIFLGISGVFAQASYRNFTFGMTIDQVRQLAPDIEVSGDYGGGIPAIDAILMYLYNPEVGSVYDPDKLPQVILPGAYSRYNSKKENIIFR